MPVYYAFQRGVSRMGSNSVLEPTFQKDQTHSKMGNPETSSVFNKYDTLKQSKDRSQRKLGFSGQGVTVVGQGNINEGHGDKVRGRISEIEEEEEEEDKEVKIIVNFTCSIRNVAQFTASCRNTVNSLSASDLM